MPWPRVVEKALRSSRFDPMLPVSAPFALSNARPVEEPGAVVPHAGICKGAARQRGFYLNGKMKSFVSLALGLVALPPLIAASNAAQAAARRIPTSKFSKMLIEAAGRDGEPGLSMKELEDQIGERDEIRETNILRPSLKWIYHLSDGRRLEVMKGGDSVVHAAIVNGQQVELVWK